MKTGRIGIALIKEYESFQPKMYICPGGYETIGYGTVIDIKEEEWKAVISEQEAEELLKKVLELFERHGNKMVRSEINQHQFDALVSFTYNVGQGNLKMSTLLKKVNADPHDPTIGDEFKKWIYANGKPLNGLRKRREAEAALYFAKVFDFQKMHS
jgi:lysozyme